MSRLLTRLVPFVPALGVVVLMVMAGPQAGLAFAAGSMVSAVIGLVIWSRGLG